MGLARTGEKDQRAVDKQQEMRFAGILFLSVPTQPVQWREDFFLSKNSNP